MRVCDNGAEIRAALHRRPSDHSCVRDPTDDDANSLAPSNSCTPPNNSICPGASTKGGSQHDVIQSPPIINPETPAETHHGADTCPCMDMYCISPCICDIHHCDSSGTWAGMDLISSREKLLMQPITLTKAITPPLAENILPNQGHVLRVLSWIPLNHAKLRRRDRASPGQFRDLANGLFPGQIALLRRLTTLPGGRTNTGLPAPRRGTIDKLQMPLILSFRRSTARREIFDHQARGSRPRPLN